jgi:serine/threonine protein kinase
MSSPGSESWSRVSSLFNELVVLDSAKRRVRLSEIGSNEPRIRDAVESLLAADAEADKRLAKFDFGLSDLIRTSAAASNSADPLRLIGRDVSHFQILDHVASGGMGVVYKARDARLDRVVALKFPLPHHQLDPEVKERFLREARSAGSLEHVNLCTVLEAGESEEGVFLAMPLYPGETLKERLTRGRLAIENALDIAEQIATGLTYAHDAGVIHRDLKPGNVMLLPDGTVKILDFGLAKAGDISRTKSGVTLGTVSYMAPEQIRGGKVDARADLWSLGVLLYEMLTGVRPFTGEHEASIANAILNADPKLPAALRRDLPRSLQSLVTTLLQKDPRIRYQSAKDLVLDLEAVKRGGAAAFRPHLRPRAISWISRRRIPIYLLIAAALTGGVALSAPRLVSQFNKPTRNDEAYQFYLRGRSYERLGPMSAAESLYRKALALDSGFALARARLAVVYADCRRGGSRDCYRRNLADKPADRTEEIRHEAQRALRLEPDLADAHLAMGLYWEIRKRPDSALTELTIARKGLDQSGDVHAAIGRAYRAKGQWDAAIRELERAIALDPGDATSIADLATTLSRLRRYDESAHNWNRYLALVPDAYHGMMIKGNVYLRWLGTIDTLAALFDQLPASYQKGFYTTHVLIARIRNQPEEALAALNEAPGTLPDDPASYLSISLQRAQVYTDLNDSVRARAYFDTTRMEMERAVALRPDDYRRHVALGLAYAGLGRAEDAKRSALRAIASSPLSRDMITGTTAMRGAAEIFAQLPQYHPEAIRILEQLMRMPAGREVSVSLLKVEPDWKPIRAEPEFQRLVTKYSAQTP